MNLQDMMVHRDNSSRTVDKYLMSYEGRVIAVRKHPAVLLVPVAAFVAGPAACGAVSAVTGIAWVWWLWLITVAYLAWKVVAWSVEFFLVTEHRVMVINGVFNRNVVMMPLTKLTDITLNRSMADGCSATASSAPRPRARSSGCRASRTCPTRSSSTWRSPR